MTNTHKRKNQQPATQSIGICLTRCWIVFFFLCLTNTKLDLKKNSLAVWYWYLLKNLFEIKKNLYASVVPFKIFLILFKRNGLQPCIKFKRLWRNKFEKLTKIFLIIIYPVTKKKNVLFWICKNNFSTLLWPIS